MKEFPSASLGDEAEEDLAADSDEKPEDLADHPRRARRRKNTIAILAIFLLSVMASSVLVYIESGSLIDMEGGNVSSLERGVWQATLMLNILITMLLIFLIFRNLIKLYFERKRKKIGARLRTKLVVAFVSFSLIPSILLYMLASGLVRETFDKLLLPDVERVYQNALDLAGFYHEQDVDATERFADYLAGLIGEKQLLQESKRDDLKALLEEKTAEYGLEGIQVLQGKSEIARIEAPDGGLSAKFFEFDENRIDQLLKKKRERIVENPSEGDTDVISCAVPIKSADDTVSGAVVVKYVVRPEVSASKDRISSSITRYKLFSTKEGWKQKIYVFLVLILTLLIVFAATWFGFYLAKVMTRPIERLLKGLQSVARGDLAVHLSGETNDEMGLLVNAFNKMVADLKASRTAVNKAESQLSRSSRDYDRRRRHMEAILSNIATGVVSLNIKGKVTIANEAALSMLNLQEETCVQRDYKEVFFVPDLRELGLLIQDLVRGKRSMRERECTVTVRGQTHNLLVTLALLRDTQESEMGFVVVFEDLSQLLKAKKAAAWREVARRIAHEIKNPLTPIQLYAQRLQKQSQKLGADDDGLFKECVDTIIQEINGLKLLVNEFSRFARMPEVQARPSDLHKIITEVLTLYDGNLTNAKIETHLDSNVPMANLDAEQMKQVFRNLINNALEAANEFVTIDISTNYDSVLKIVRIELADDGTGIDKESKDKLFLPYFSTKKRGTGLGLAIAQRIIEDHGGYIRVQDNVPKGTRFIIELPGGTS
ncbi:MAG: PAS domain-containing protein [Candidatus Coatesbacteria bacterium]|nr:PAS domain-containing protein [Candidatus Coatesbacteria bacterium]